MSAREIKVSKALPKEDLAAFFEELARWLDGGEAVEGLPRPAEVAALKMRVEDLGVHYSVKMKIKKAPEAGAPAEGDPAAAMGYKPLKKKLRADMKSLAWYLSESRLPPAHELDAFLAHCQLMTRFPGQGDEYYAPFLAAVDQLRAAVAAQDLDGMAAAVQELNRVKKECHAKYK